MAVLSRETILEYWLERVLRMYPGQGAKFLAGERDPFRNPAGSTMRHALTVLLEELSAGMDRERTADALDAIVQIRAVQGLEPSQALEFLFQLKEIMRPDLAGPERELVEARIDELALLAFDFYMKYRERTYQARTNEARRRIFVMERRQTVSATQEWQERGGI